MEVSECSLHIDCAGKVIGEGSGSHGNNWNISGSWIPPIQPEFPQHPFYSTKESHKECFGDILADIQCSSIIYELFMRELFMKIPGKQNQMTFRWKIY